MFYYFYCFCRNVKLIEICIRYEKRLVIWLLRQIYIYNCNIFMNEYFILVIVYLFIYFIIYFNDNVFLKDIKLRGNEYVQIDLQGCIFLKVEILILCGVFGRMNIQVLFICVEVRIYVYGCWSILVV